MKHRKLLLCLPVLALLAGCAGKDIYSNLNAQAAREYLEPVRPASEGRNPCWNGFAKKFMYAPAFDIAPAEGAENYRFTVTPKEGEGAWTFTAKDPGADLSPIWNEIVPGHVKLTVEALDASGKPAMCIIFSMPLFTFMEPVIWLVLPSNVCV